MKIYYLVSLLAGGLHAYGQESPNTNSVPAAVLTPEYIAALKKEAAEQNPAYAAAQSKVRAAEANAKSIPLFADPNLVVGGMAAERMMRMEDGDVVVGVEQELPIFGKPLAARQVARREIEVETASTEAEKLRLQSDLAKALFRVALADTITAIAAEDQQWRETILAVAAERYRLGRASQVDVLRLQNERSTQAERVKTETANRESEAATVNRLLNRHPLSYVPPLALPTNSIPLPQHDTLYLSALRVGPMVRGLKSETARAEAQLRMTKAEARPNVMLDLQSRQYARTPEWRSTEVMLKFSLPLVNRSSYKKAQERERHLKDAAEKLLENGKNQLNEDIHHLMVKIDAAQREAALYRDEIIPRTEQTLNNARAAWQNNNDSLRDVLDARRMLLEARLMQARAVAEQWSTLADLAVLCGLSDLNDFYQLIKSESGNMNPSAETR